MPVLLAGSLGLAVPTFNVDARATPGPLGVVEAASTTTVPPTDAGEASTDANPTWGTGPDVDGRAQRVMALSVVGRWVYLGGEFTAMVPPGSTWPMPTTTTTTTLTSTTTAATSATPVSAMAASEPEPPPPPGSQKRNHLAALDVERGTLLPWNPDADGVVHALVVSADGTKLYVGGEFDHIGGTAAPAVARIDLATGNVDPTFRAAVRGRVRALALSGDRLYVGGSFGAVGGPGGDEPRPKLAALDAATGELLPWTPPPLGPGAYVGQNGAPTPTEWSGDVLAIAVPGDGSRVYVGGAFLDLGGESGLVVLDAVTGLALPEQWDVGRPIFDLAVWPVDGETVFASAGGPGGRLYAFRADHPGEPLWSAWVDGDAPGVAASANDVYLMGHYDYAGPESLLRRHLAAFDASTGAVDDWNPTANTPTGAFSAAVGAGHVFVGGDFTRINGRPQPGFAQFDLVPSPPPTSTTSTTGATTTSNTSTTTTPRRRPRDEGRPPRRPPPVRRR